MPTNSQRRAKQAQHRLSSGTGLGRFEVRGLEADKALIRSLARRLAAKDDAARTLRAELARRVAGSEPPRVGGVLAVLRRSPLVGADLDLTREESFGCEAGM